MKLQILCMDSRFKSYVLYAGGEVHSVYRRTINIWFGGDLYTILSGGGIAPYTACANEGLDFQALGIKPGVLVQPAAGGLQIGSLEFSCSEAVLWKPAAASAPVCPADGVKQFDLWICNQNYRKGCTGCYRKIYMGDDIELGYVQQFLCQRIEKLAECFKSSTDSAVSATVNLTGLGEGLTPSGDDFICGFLLAAYRYGGPVASEFITALKKKFSPADLQTTAVSCQMLKACLSDGLAMQLYLSACNAFLSKPTDLPALLNQAATVGHSSGLDTCVGIAVGIRCLL